MRGANLRFHCKVLTILSQLCGTHYSLDVEGIFRVAYQSIRVRVGVICHL